MPHLKPTDLDMTKLSDYFVWKDTSERGSTLWIHRCQEASEFLCTKTPLFGGSWATKNIAKKTRKCTLRRATNVTFSEFRGWRRKKKSRSARFFETALRAVLIYSLIYSLIRGQAFWQVVSFTALHKSWTSFAFKILCAIVSKSASKALVDVVNSPAGGIHLQ